MRYTNPQATIIVTNTQLIQLSPIDFPSFHTPSTLKVTRIQ